MSQPNTRFQVHTVVQRLCPEHLLADSEPGGFPDDVWLVPPSEEVAQAVPKELQLHLGRQEVDIEAPLLGRGSFAKVRQGVYAFSASRPPTRVAFKIFRDTQQMDQKLRQQVRKPSHHHPAWPLRSKASGWHLNGVGCLNWVPV